MSTILKHITRCIVAGIIAILPIGGTILFVVYVESELADSWIGRQEFYFPGMAMLACGVILYVLGLVVSSVLGRWIISLVDRLLRSLPALGRLYSTLKQILGYSEGGEDAVFRRAVLVDSPYDDSQELGLVTNEMLDEKGRRKVLVFLPGSPNPATGRLILIPEDEVKPLDIQISEALRTLLSVGATSLPGKIPGQSR
jgi:uncharacterized membrane protein